MKHFRLNYNEDSMMGTSYRSVHNFRVSTGKIIGYHKRNKEIFQMNLNSWPSMSGGCIVAKNRPCDEVIGVGGGSFSSRYHPETAYAHKAIRSILLRVKKI